MSLEDNLLRHVLGAGCTSKTPFSSLPSAGRVNSLNKLFVEKWVLPFYLNDPCESEFKRDYKERRHDIDDGIIEVLLGEFNWRPRGVGAIFAAAEGRSNFIPTIATLLLKSELCYSGKRYAVALTVFGSEECSTYLERYLEYYLTRNDLWYDQGEVLAALKFLDHEKGTTKHARFLDAWASFIADKPDHDLSKFFNKLSLAVSAVRQLGG